MAESLAQFLMETSTEDLTDVVKMRLKRNAREIVGEFKITAIDSKQWARYQEQTTKIKKGNKHEFDQVKFNELVVLNHTVEPDFKNAEKIKQAGCTTPEQYLNKKLLIGEIVELSRNIVELSGFSNDLDELKEEIKNS